MSTSIIFTSKASALSVTRRPTMQPQVVSGRLVEVPRHVGPFEFEGGIYKATPQEAEELRESPFYGQLFFEAPSEEEAKAKVEKAAASAGPGEGAGPKQAPGETSSEQKKAEVEPIEGVTNKQEALEALAARNAVPEGLDLGDTKAEIVKAAREAGYAFVGYGEEE